jgi:hypothetical protein
VKYGGKDNTKKHTHNTSHRIQQHFFTKIFIKTFDIYIKNYTFASKFINNLIHIMMAEEKVPQGAAK